jgi:hypothetical protein
VALRVGAIQSAYIPWRGYFDFIASVDLFVIYDDVPYSKNSWRNRNRIKTPRGMEWLTVPVHGRLNDRIDEVVNYDFVRDEVTRIVTQGHIDLQETLCDTVLAAMLAHPQVVAARVSTRKPDVYDDCDAVGVETFRHKPPRP